MLISLMTEMHLAVGNSFIVPHILRKDGYTEDGVHLRIKSREMLSCFPQIQQRRRKLPIDLHCACLH